jgi:hypothetical protein
MKKMNRRLFLSLPLAGLAMGTSVPAARAQDRQEPAGKLIVADQSEFVRNLLEAGGERDKLKFQLELPNFAGGPAIYEAIRAKALDIAFVGDTPPIQARAAGTLLPIVATFTREVAEYRLTSRPGLVIHKLAELKGKRLSYIEGSSAARAYTGLALGVAVGVALALLSGLTRTGEALIDGVVQIKRAIPTLALIPLAIVWLGIGEAMKIFLIFTAVLVPIYVNTHAALRGIDIGHIEPTYARKFGS